MTYRQALDYAKNVFDKKHFMKPDAPDKVEALDVQNTIASAEVTAWWGIDYILLSKQNDHWMWASIVGRPLQNSRSIAWLQGYKDPYLPGDQMTA